MNAPTNIQWISLSRKPSGRSLLLTFVVALFAAIGLLLVSVKMPEAQAQEQATQTSQTVATPGQVWAWGANWGGQLGDGTTTNRTTPVQVSNLSDVTDISGGLYFSLALKNDGTLWAWGDNYYGQLGDGTTTERHTPVKVSGLSGVQAVDAYNHSIVVVPSDTTAPTSTATATAGGITYNSGDWTNKDVTLTLTASDESGSGVDKILYNTNGGTNYQPYTEPLSFTSGTQTTVHFYATDKAGNEETPQTFTVKLDKTAPSAPTASFLDSSGNPVQPVYTDSSGVKWFKEAVTVHYGSSSDPDLADGTPGSGNISYTPEDTHSTDGTYDCSGTATDQAGNVSIPTELKVGIDKGAPTAKVPTHSFTTLSTLGTTTVPVKLTWSATDNPGGSGIASYQLQQSVNGGAYTNVALPSTTATTISPSLAPGTNTYRYRVAAKDKAGNLSAWATGPSFKVRVFQESNSAIVDKGSWTTSALSGAYGGSVQYASALGRNATFSVPAGSKNVEWVSYRGNNRGKAQVWLDGVQQDANPNLTGIQPFDLYSSTAQARKVVFSKAVSATTSHKLEIRVLGQKNASSTSTRVDIDAFVTTS